MTDNDDILFEENDPLLDLDGFEDLDDVITLFDEDGNGTDFQVLDFIDRGDDRYAVLYPLDDENEEGALVIMLMTEDETDYTFEGVDDDEIITAVYKEFKELHKDDFTFADDDEE